MGPNRALNSALTIRRSKQARLGNLSCLEWSLRHYSPDKTSCLAWSTSTHQRTRMETSNRHWVPSFHSRSCDGAGKDHRSLMQNQRGSHLRAANYCSWWIQKLCRLASVHQSTAARRSSSWRRHLSVLNLGCRWTCNCALLSTYIFSMHITRNA